MNGWKDVPQWANWRSVDKDGTVKFFNGKPSSHNGYWLCGNTLDMMWTSEERELLNQYQLDNWPSGMSTERPKAKEEDYYGIELVETKEMKKAKVGFKLDSGKPRFALIPQEALLDVAKVMTYGANKYAPDNWRKVDDAHNRYMDAALRHINSHLNGNIKDSESGLPHLAHAVCSLMMAMESPLWVNNEETN